MSAKEQFRQAVQDLGIKAALFDYDGTLADTNALFLQARDAFYAYCYSCFCQPPFALTLSQEEFTDQFRRLDAFSYKANHGGVDPYRRWHHLVPYVATEFLKEKIGNLGMATFLNEGLAIYAGPYQQIPIAFPQAHATLTLCQEAGIPTIVVTHAHALWTEYKIQHSGLLGVIDKVYAVSVDQQKLDGWKQVLHTEQLSPHEVMVIGDSIASDMRPAASLGIPHLYYLANTVFFNADQELPPQALTIHSLVEFPTAVVKTWQQTRMSL